MNMNYRSSYYINKWPISSCVTVPRCIDHYFLCFPYILNALPRTLHLPGRGHVGVRLA